ncbi:MAG: maleylpyruvate isomerase N-terminal domain-containing protein [Vicinamibacterales bacterium]
MARLPAPLPPIDALGALVDTDAQLLPLLEGLTAAEWDRPTIVPRWRVRHVAGHLLDTALRRLSAVRDGCAVEGPASGRADDLRTYIDRVNAEGVAVYGRLSPAALAALMRVAVTDLHAHFAGLDPEAPAAFAVSWAGDATSPVWFDVARELTERWHHQAQIRLALDRPALTAPALYHPVLDTFMRVLPHAYRHVEAAEGTHVECVVTGAAGGTWRLVRGGRHWRLTGDALDGAAARVTVPEALAWRLFTKGLGPAERASSLVVDGDAALAAPLLDAVAIVG